MSQQSLTDKANTLADKANELAADAAGLAMEAGRTASEQMGAVADGGHGPSMLVIGLTVFVLAVFVGYHVVWRVTPALHSPLMGVTNAISSVIIVGGLIAAGPAEGNFSQVMGFFAVTLAAVNIFGGFIVTQRMLSMFKKKQQK